MNTLYENKLSESLTDTSSAILPNILHFFGSTKDDFFDGLSLLYAREAYDNLVFNKDSPVSQTYNHVLLHSHADGTWSFPVSLTENDILKAEKVSVAAMMKAVNILKPVAAAPYMFCWHGMITIRGLFEMMNVPVIGNSPESMALSENKWRTRCILKAAGVPIPSGELLIFENGTVDIPQPCAKPPFIIKPCSEANSLGVSLYNGNNDEELQSALEEAFRYDDEVIVEQFIPLGYEVRVGVIEDEERNLVVLPICNYLLQHPIRTLDAKLNINQNGIPTKLTKCEIELPAKSLPNLVVSTIERYAKIAHKALGCRHYSLFDVRVAPDGIPHFIEASLYCSYAATSIISKMSEAAGRKSCDLFNIALERTIKRNERKQKNVK